MNNPSFEVLNDIETKDIIEYLEHFGYTVRDRPLSLDELTEQVEEHDHSVIPNEGLYLTDKQLGDIHMLAYSGQREEAIKEILALVVPTITNNPKVLS